MIYGLVFVCGLFASYFGTFFSGGVSSLSVGILLLLGIPPHLATTTYLIGSLGGTASATYKFGKSGNIPKKFLPLLSVLAITGGILGSLILYKIPAGVMYKVTGVTLLVLLFIGIWKKHIGNEERTHSKKRIAVGYVVNFLTAIYGVVFPAGVGVLFYFIYTGLFGMTSLQARGIGSVLGFVWAVPITLAIFLSGQFNIFYIVFYMMGTIIGSYIGAGHAVKTGNEILRKIILAGVGALALCFLFWK